MLLHLDKAGKFLLLALPRKHRQGNLVYWNRCCGLWIEKERDKRREMSVTRRGSENFTNFGIKLLTFCPQFDSSQC